MAAGIDAHKELPWVAKPPEGHMPGFPIGKPVVQKLSVFIEIEFRSISLIGKFQIEFVQAASCSLLGHFHRFQLHQIFTKQQGTVFCSLLPLEGKIRGKLHRLRQKGEFLRLARFSIHKHVLPAPPL